MLTPTPLATPTPTPAPAESVAPVAPVVRMTLSAPQQAKYSGAFRRKLLASSALFLLLLLALVFFVGRLLRQLREERQGGSAPISQEPSAAIGKQQLRGDGQAAVARRLKRSDKAVPKRLKNRMRKARHI